MIGVFSCISSNEHEIVIKSENNVFAQGDILPIEDYVKFIVLNYQHKFPDTELSKKLGIQWESIREFQLKLFS